MGPPHTKHKPLYWIYGEIWFCITIYLVFYIFLLDSYLNKDILQLKQKKPYVPQVIDNCTSDESLSTTDNAFKLIIEVCHMSMVAKGMYNPQTCCILFTGSFQR
jgi:hypothetical protein